MAKRSKRNSAATEGTPQILLDPQVEIRKLSAWPHQVVGVIEQFDTDLLKLNAAKVAAQVELMDLHSALQTAETTIAELRRDVSRLQANRVVEKIKS